MFGKMTLPQLVSRTSVLAFNPNRRAITPPVATSSDNEDAAETREMHFLLIASRVLRGKAAPEDLADELKDCGRTVADLEAEIASIRKEGTSATSPSAKVTSPVQKESPMSEHEKRQVKNEWDAAIQAQHAAHPSWDKSQCVRAVVKENPELHQRFIAAANAR